ncbi:MAG: CDP-alcohol phosphatidyltransferase [Candidatus Eisenbacteria bacterium]|uniref:CDP-alcohol phosphatidyltransferase n=1 Tax=Eiseniibacteriota bacterium TaxID=2212470 RepID=A0A538T1C8_UNCEI|nr:MAG: CDP-alcohol phosphatidyltransferase [Candidatus Eisenbacteria bacterium]
MGADTPTHERKSIFFLAGFERRVLPRIAAALPRWVVPDHLTLLGVLAATWIAIAYGLSNRDEAWLWAASGGLLVHWFGDSLDGTLARVRKIERPRYGFYLDHLTDAYSTTAIGIGLGLSPYMLLSVGLAIVIAYLVLSINVYLETHAFGEFQFGYAWMGPTEARALLIALNTFALFRPPLPFHVGVVGATIFDVIGLIGALTMAVLLIGRVARNLKRLGAMEPPKR